MGTEALQEFGKYQLLRRLATGGMAEVYLARSAGPVGFQKQVVIKRMLPHLVEDPVFVEMFLNEAKIVANLAHPNIVQVFDLGEHDGSYFLAMEYIEGLNLRSLLRRLTAAGLGLAPELAARIVANACAAMAYAHEFSDPATGEPLGLIHRDLSPENILLSVQGEVKIVDFGVAKISSQPRFTRTGMLKGKLAYMPPEQLRGESLDRQVDIFALGVVLYELLSGVRPFDGASEAAMIRSILDDPPLPVETRRPEVAAELAAITARAIAKSKLIRYPNCQEMKADLERYLARCGVPATSAELGAQVRPYVEQIRPPTQAGGSGFTARTPLPAPLPTPARHQPVGDHLRTATMDGAPTSVQATVPIKRSTTGELQLPAEAPSVKQFTVAFEGSAENLLVRLLASYGDHQVAVEPGASDFAVVTQSGRRTMIKRAPEEEAAALKVLSELGLRFKSVLGRFQLSGEPAVDLLAQGPRRFPREWSIDASKARFSLLPPVEVALRVDLEGEQFALEATFRSGSEPVATGPVLAALQGGKRYLKLRDGHAPLDEGLAPVVEAFSQHQFALEPRQAVPRARAEALQQLIETSLNVVVEPAAREALDSLRPS